MRNLLALPFLLFMYWRWKRPALFLFLCLTLAQFSRAQLVSQGNEQVVTYSGSTAFVLSNSPVNPNLLVTTGTNTFIMNVNPPTNAIRVYITNDTANACANLTVSIASTGNNTLNSFNNFVNAWQSILIQSGNGGFAATQPVTVPANGTIAVTSQTIIGSKIALFVVLSSGCLTTSIDLQVVFGTFSPNNTSIQGVVATGANGTGVNPVIVGGLNGAGNSEPYGACPQGLATCSAGTGNAIPFGANNFTTAGVVSGGVSAPNALGTPLAEFLTTLDAVSGVGGIRAPSSSGGNSGSPNSNPPGLMVSNTGFFNEGLTSPITGPGTSSVHQFAPGSSAFGNNQGSISFHNCYVQIHAVNNSGTTPTLDIYFQTSESGSGAMPFNDRIHFAQVTTGTSDQFAGISSGSGGITPAAVQTQALAASTKVDGPIGAFGQITFVTGGTAPNYSVTWGISCF